MKNPGFKFDTTYTNLPEMFFTRLNPEQVTAPQVVLFNEALAKGLGLDLSSMDTKEQAQLFAGQSIPEEATPFSQAYAGHQFGHFTILGDGRAHLLGEHVTPNGHRVDIQFKGSGQTPYSRRGDGKAALGPMLREYIISEAKHYLGIPTTRSLAVVTTGEAVIRDTVLPGAILTRVASSHIRVGTFEYAAEVGDNQSVEALMEYTIHRHYPELKDHTNPALALLKAAMEKQIDLIVEWMRIGFIHGVMNTDNMTLCGESIDYGPCAFMDAYHPGTVFSSIDQNGRYAYINQPAIAQWNLARLAETLLPWVASDLNQAVEQAKTLIHSFTSSYQDKWFKMMCSKMGINDPIQEDEQLLGDLLEWMKNNHADYTKTFRDLSQEHQPLGGLYEHETFQSWYQRWQIRVEEQPTQAYNRVECMKKLNPAIIARNHQVEIALAAAHEKDMKPLNQLLAAIKSPYDEHPEFIAYQKPPEPSDQIYQTFCGT